MDFLHFSQTSIATAFLIALFSHLIFNGLHAFAPSLVRFAGPPILLVGLYLAFYGASTLYNGWIDPMAAVDPELVWRTAAKGRGRGGIFILIAKFWPYVCVLLGTVNVFFGWVALRNPEFLAEFLDYD